MMEAQVKTGDRQLGRIAFAIGTQLRENPFKLRTKAWMLWKAGWLERQKECKDGQR